MGKVSLATKLGMRSEASPRVPTGIGCISENDDGPWPVVDNGKDYFIERDGIRFAGMHLLIDLWGASSLDDLKLVEETLVESAHVAGATVLHNHLHHFSPNGGISGVVVLSESHISIHTWPERGYAALDIFMCGDCDPYKAIPILRRAFKPESLTISEQKRGLVP